MTVKWLPAAMPMPMSCVAGFIVTTTLTTCTKLGDLFFAADGFHDLYPS